MSDTKIAELKALRARKVGSLTRARRRAFVTIDCKGSRTQLCELMKEIDQAYEAVEEVHFQYISQLSDEDELKGAKKYLEQVEQQRAEAIDKIKEHLESRKDEPPSVTSSHKSECDASVHSGKAKSREAEIQAKVKQCQVVQAEQELGLQEEELALKKRRKMFELKSAHDLAKLEATLQKAALDDLEWDRRDDFKGEEMLEDFRFGDKVRKVVHDSQEACRVEASFVSSIPKISLPIFNGNCLEWPKWLGLFEAMVDKQPSLSKTEKMIHLQSAVSGLAYKTISGFLLNPELYDEALCTLKERFGRERDVIRAQGARVQEVYPGSDGRIRSVELVTAAGTTYRRPVTKVCFLEESD